MTTLTPTTPPRQQQPLLTTPSSSMATVPKYGHKTLTTASNLATLLPTGTVLVFQALIPSFSNNGACSPSNKFLTLSIIFVSSLACFLSSFTDTFVGKDGKLYYGVATFKGLYLFNDNLKDDYDPESDLEDVGEKYKLTLTDFVHAICSLVVFLVFAISSFEVQSCFFSSVSRVNLEPLIVNLPLGVGMLASFLFVIFPTRRRGIGFADIPPANPTTTGSSSRQEAP